MNATIIKVAAGLVILASILWALACGAGSGNNKNGTASVDQEQLDADAACDETNINARRDRVANRIAKGIEGKSKLQEQVNSGLFAYNIEVIEPDRNSLQMTVSGGVGDVHDNSNKVDYDNFHDLVGIVQKFVRKKCTSRVVFASSANTNAAASDSALTLSGDFRWFACEWPNVPCNGACLPSCDKGTSHDLNSGGNANGPVNSNSNAAPKSNQNKKDG